MEGNREDGLKVGSEAVEDQTETILDKSEEQRVLNEKRYGIGESWFEEISRSKAQEVEMGEERDEINELNVEQGELGINHCQVLRENVGGGMEDNLVEARVKEVEKNTEVSETGEVHEEMEAHLSEVQSKGMMQDNNPQGRNLKVSSEMGEERDEINELNVEQGELGVNHRQLRMENVEGGTEDNLLEAHVKEVEKNTEVSGAGEVREEMEAHFPEVQIEGMMQDNNPQGRNLVVSSEKEKIKQQLEEADGFIDDLRNFMKCFMEKAMENGATMNNLDDLFLDSYKLWEKGNKLPAILMEINRSLMEKLKQKNSEAPCQKRHAEVEATTLEELSSRKMKQIRLSNQHEDPMSQTNLTEVSSDAWDECENIQMPTANLSWKATVSVQETELLDHGKQNAFCNEGSRLGNNEEQRLENPMGKRLTETKVHPSPRLQQIQGQRGDASTLFAKKFSRRKQMHEQPQRQLRPRATPKPSRHKSAIRTVGPDGADTLQKRNLGGVVTENPQGEGENVVLQVHQTMEEQPLSTAVGLTPMIKKKAPGQLRQKKLCPRDQSPLLSETREKLLTLQDEDEQEHLKVKRKGRPSKVKSDVNTEQKQRTPKDKLKVRPRKEKKNPNDARLGKGRVRLSKLKSVKNLDSSAPPEEQEQQLDGQREASHNTIPATISGSSECVATSEFVLSLPVQPKGRGRPQKETDQQCDA